MMNKQYTHRELIEAQLNGETVQELVHEFKGFQDMESTLECCVSELDAVANDYRIKPKMRKVRCCNGVELPQCVTEPLDEGTPYYYTDLGFDNCVGLDEWSEEPIHLCLLKRGIIYLNVEDACAHFNAIMNVTIKEVEE